MTTATHINTQINFDSRLSSHKRCEYALFTLPHVCINGKNMVTDEKAIVSIPFRARLLEGDGGHFTVKMGNGVTGMMTIRPGVFKHDVYDDHPELHHMINNLPFDDFDITTSNDYVELLIRPTINWLEAGQRFHVFKIALGFPQKIINNKVPAPPYQMPDILFGIQRPG
jgi:hypothetical protein